MSNSATVNTIDTSIYPDEINEAASRIAPAWPLDNAIAVNPWWELRDYSFQDVAAKLETLGHTKCLMPKSFYLKHWQTLIDEGHLQRASAEKHFKGSSDELVAALHSDDPALPHWHNFSELLDALPEHSKKMPWQDEIQQQISQFCGLYFQHSEQILQGSLYSAWLHVARKDKGIEVLMGEDGLNDHFINLPDNPMELCTLVKSSFNNPDHFSDYCHALLIDIHGWASWMAYNVWQDKFAKKDNTLTQELLAIRLAWEWVLWSQSQTHQPDTFKHLRSRFLSQFDELPKYIRKHKEQQQLLWVWQRALELSYQSQLHRMLLNTPSAETLAKPSLQAAFCIDVRSEPMRRALEAQHSGIETIGFAGFFGLPLEYSPEGTHYSRPQLPGLLSPVIQATQRTGSTEKPSSSIHFNNRQQSAFEAAPASLGLVEMFGIFKAGSLLKQSIMPGKTEHAVNHLCDDRPFELSMNGVPIDLATKVSLANDVLTNMGLTKRFGSTILLLGHGSCTSNNPQAASLDCGACGGQTGEVNVKVLAQLLNDEAVRTALRDKGIKIPSSTQFVAGQHNTTTDEISLFGHYNEGPWQDWLQAATKKAQRNRAASLNLEDNAKLEAKYQQRSKNWAEVRPEWGLANNAAFIVGPRSLTKSINLEGRSFLHDYQWESDEGFATLELIMTAPMIVTNWINLQYYASVVDNKLYGSGNKLLHNVVGEHIGVFEGNGGDLRIGLSKQSLHDGKDWRHIPQRLNVYIDAPQEEIANIIEKHEMLGQLINNDWLYLFHLDKTNSEISRYYQGNWHRT